MGKKKIYKFTGFDRVIFNGIELNQIPLSIDDCRWDEIQSMIQVGNFADYYSVGDIKNIKLTTGETMQMMVTSINDGSNDPGRFNGQYYPDKTVDFISVNGTSNNANLTRWRDSVRDEKMIPWTDSLTRSALNNYVFKTLPEDLQSIIIPKDHFYDGYTYNKSTNTCSLTYFRSQDKLWLPTIYELGLESALAYLNPLDRNKKYPIFNNYSDRRKYYNKRCCSSLIYHLYSNSTPSYENRGIDEVGDFSQVNGYARLSTLICFRIG